MKRRQLLQLGLLSSLVKPSFAAFKEEFSLPISSEQSQIKAFTLTNPIRLVIDFYSYDKLQVESLLSLIKYSKIPIIQSRIGNQSFGYRAVFEVKDQIYIELAKESKFYKLQVASSKSLLSAESKKDDISDNEVKNKPEEVVSKKEYPKRKAFVVVIDPGHGGRDPGAIGPSKFYEKDFTLNFSKKLKKKLENENLKVYLTRSSDKSMPLSARVSKAREHGADLFLSVHADAFRIKSVRGASAYVLSDGRASSTAARWLADKENSADFVSGIPKPKESVLQEVLLDLSFTAKQNDSESFAKKLLKEISSFAVMHKRVVEKGSFAVLTSPDVPSTLFEAGFISNPKDESNLMSEWYTNKLVSSTSIAILKHLKLI